MYVLSWDFPTSEAINENNIPFSSKKVGYETDDVFFLESCKTYTKQPQAEYLILDARDCFLDR